VSFWELLLLAGAVMFVGMTAVFLISVRIRNFGLVDIAWAGGFSVVAALYGALGTGDSMRRALAAGMMVLWSLRLASYLYVRVMGHHPEEDGRYAELRRAWARNLHPRFFFFFQAQALLVILLAVPVLLASLNPARDLALVEWAGLALWAVAIAGESLADRQLQRFKADPASRGRVCQVGLWRYSRHPNYFFEWLIWCAFFLFALGSPHGWLTLYCPLLMLYFLFRITGIPATEEQAVRTKGEEYLEYQRTTSAFVPWFRKDAGAAR
jgi:steroid 5-alpha reductase family enzyme